MSEEKQEGFISQIKNQIVAGVGIVLAGIGTIFLDEVKSFIGIEEDESSAIEAPAQSQEVNVEGPTINLTIPQAAPTQTIIREVPAKPVEKDTVVVEKPKETSTNRLLKYKKNN